MFEWNLAKANNPAIGRFLSVDPLTKDYPQYTPYQFAGNNPLQFIDLDGLEPAEPPSPGQEDNVFQAPAENYSEYGDQKWLWNGESYFNISVDPAIVTARRTLGDKFQGAVNSLDQWLIEKTVDPTKTEGENFSDIGGKAAYKLAEIGVGLTTLGIFPTIFEQSTGIPYLKPGLSYKCITKTLGVVDDAAKTSTSLGAGRIGVKKWLQGAGNLERGQLIKDIEGVEFNKVYDAKGMMHFERGGMKIRLDPPQAGAQFNHMHLNYGSNKNAYDIFLDPVNYKSLSAHIPIR